MKKILIIFLLTNYISHSQIIQSLNISPNGTDTIDVNLETFISSTPSYYLSSTYSINNNIINLQVCYFSGNSQVAIFIPNTINIPIDNPNNYILKTDIYRSSNQTTCDFTELTDTKTLDFTTPLTDTVYLGVEGFEVLEKQINVYPNPVKDFLNITISNSITVNSLEVYNVLGAKVKTYSNNFERVNVSGLENGLYFLKFKTSKGKVTKRILVNN